MSAFRVWVEWDNGGGCAIECADLEQARAELTHWLRDAVVLTNGAPDRYGIDDITDQAASPEERA